MEAIELLRWQRRFAHHEAGQRLQGGPRCAKVDPLLDRGPDLGPGAGLPRLRLERPGLGGLDFDLAGGRLLSGVERAGGGGGRRRLVQPSHAERRARQLELAGRRLEQAIAGIVQHAQGLVPAARLVQPRRQPGGELGAEPFVEGGGRRQADERFGPACRPGLAERRDEAFAVVPIEARAVVRRHRRGQSQIAPEGEEETIQLRQQAPDSQERVRRKCAGFGRPDALQA